jgi:polyribonucleotide nucleotidyltransferase
LIKETIVAHAHEGAPVKPVQPTLAQKDGISVAPAQDGLSIAQLYANRINYDGKKIKMKGQVTKINDGVMDRNWVHIQDGTSESGNFDLTVTTTDEVKVDDVVTFEGTIHLKKDFGYGYFYEVIMEDAKVVK